eukprot:243630-Chlamydomonas_euryale.AAC.6
MNVAGRFLHVRGKDSLYTGMGRLLYARRGRFLHMHGRRFLYTSRGRFLRAHTKGFCMHVEEGACVHGGRRTHRRQAADGLRGLKALSGRVSSGHSVHEMMDQLRR